MALARVRISDGAPGFGSFSGLQREAGGLIPDDPIPKVLAKLCLTIAFPDLDKNGVKWAMELGIGIDRPDKWRFTLFGFKVPDINFDEHGHWSWIHLASLSLFSWVFWVGARDTN